jgi:DNA-binding response OmpR family regulator
MEKREIMVVDDQPPILTQVAALLKDAYNVRTFKSGKEALRYLEKNIVDFILLDYYMPEMTGFQVLMQVRRNKATSRTPVAFLTTEISERMEFEMMQRGANDYMCKPVESSKLRRCIEKHIGK